MASNRESIIKNRFGGDEEAYKAWMKELAAKPHKRGGRSKFIKQIEIKAAEEGISVDVLVRKIIKK